MGRLLAQRPAVTPTGPLEPEALVEGVRFLPALRRRHEENAAAPRRCLLLDRFDQQPADSPAAVRLRNDEGTELAGRALVLDRRGNVQVGEADHLALHVGDDDPVADDHQSLAPWGTSGPRCGLAARPGG